MNEQMNENFIYTRFKYLTCGSTDNQSDYEHFSMTSKEFAVIPCEWRTDKSSEALHKKLFRPSPVLVRQALRPGPAPLQRSPIGTVYQTEQRSPGFVRNHGH